MLMARRPGLKKWHPQPLWWSEKLLLLVQGSARLGGSALFEPSCCGTTIWLVVCMICMCTLGGKQKEHFCLCLLAWFSLAA